MKDRSSQPVPSQILELPGENTIILIDSEYNHYLSEKFGTQPWYPQRSEMKVIESILDKAIEKREFDFLKRPIKKNIYRYYLQYIPYINNRGERIMKINALCEIPEIPISPDVNSSTWNIADWKKEYISVSDGGSCYWQMIINIDQNSYESLMINGEG